MIEDQFWFGLGVAFLALGLALGWFVWAQVRRKNRLKELDRRVLLVKIPQFSAKDKEKDFLHEISKTEQLFNALTSIGRPVVFEVAVHNTGSDIFFYVTVPRSSADFVAEQIQGLFPESQVDQTGEYTIFNQTGSTVAGRLKLTDSKVLPIRTYREAEVDTFAPIVSTLSKLEEEGDGAALQVVINPAPKKIKNNIQQAIEKLKKGCKLTEATASDWSVDKLVGDLSGKSKDKKDQTDRSIDEELIKAVQKKTEKPLWLTNIRLITSAKDQNRAEDLFLSLAGSFGQFSAPRRNGFKLVRAGRRSFRDLIWHYIFRNFDRSHTLLLNSEELAGVWHLPTQTTDIPRVKWLQTKEASPPGNLPAEGTVLGESVFRGQRRTVKMTTEDRRRHLYVIGQTGTGKSYAMLNLASQDIKSGHGLCLIDPHGDLVDKVLEVVPASRAEDVIVFNPGDITRPLGLNMLEYDPSRPEEKTFIVNEIQSIFNRLFSSETMGPVFEQYMRNALMLLMEDSKNEPATLMEVPRVFTDDNFRERKLARIVNPSVVDFWEKEAAKTTGEQSLANISPYITSKFGNFIANDYMRPIIGQTRSAFNFRSAMDQGKIILVNLSKGRIGDINAGLLGMIITGRLLLSALSRTDIPEDDRRDFFLYIDEFQNFTTDSISVILAEARKYKLNLTLAHQFIGQLTDEIRESVFGNVGSMAAFRVGASDAEVLTKHFGPVFSEHDLISIENQNALIKLLINGEPSRPFNIKTLHLGRGSAEMRESVKELSRLTYGRDLNQIEKDILARLRN